MRGGACLACRRRKSRCKLEPTFASCLMCHSHGTPCEFPPSKGRNRITPATLSTTTPTPPQLHFPTVTTEEQGHAPTTSGPANTHDEITGPVLRSTGLRASASNPSEVPQFPLNDPVCQEPQALDPIEENSNNQRLLGPVLDSDSQVLSDIVTHGLGGRRIARTIWTRSATGLSAPIVFTETRRRPVGLTANLNPAKAKLEIIEKFLEPFIPRLVDLFMKQVNPCLPLLNELEFTKYHSDLNLRRRISPAFLACLYAHTLAFWASDPVLAAQRRPDQRFVWNLASEALYSELRLSPGIHTIAGILLNVGGRPTTLVFNNAGQLGFAISIAFTLGLNRDPSEWDIPDHEKRLRVNIWWALIIHDRWSSLAYGIPPRIRNSHTDVPKPNMALLACPLIGDQPATNVFVALMSLTDVLNEFLEVIYQVGQPLSANNSLTNRLHSWTESTSGVLRRIVLRGSDLSLPGAANLRLAFLSLQFLDSRIQLEACRRDLGEKMDEKLAGQYLQTRRAAEEIVLLIQELGPVQLRDFWLPEAAFYLSSVMSFLMRSAIELEDTAAGLSGNVALSLAGDLMASLGSHKESEEWDVGDLCLTQYSDILDQIQRLQFDVSVSQMDPEVLDAIISDASFQDNMLFPRM